MAVFKSLTQDDQTERLNQPALLRDRNKHARRDHAALRVLAAQTRFLAIDFAMTDLRQAIKLQLSRLEAGPQAP